MKVEITKKNVATGDATPKYWSPLAPYMCLVLENPDADEDAKRFSRNEFERLAKITDKNAEINELREWQQNRSKALIRSLQGLLDQLGSITGKDVEVNYKRMASNLANGHKCLEELKSFTE
jgi:hypothetical protein